MHDLAIIIVSTNESHWIRALLPTLFDHIGDIDADVVVVDNDSTDGIADLIATEYPGARTVWSANHGMGHANNRGIMTSDARYVLVLNPDTEILEGSFAELVRLMDERPTVGLAGCRQIVPEDNSLTMTGRYFPNALRALGDAAFAERLGPRRPRWLGEREIDPAAYDRELDLDWTTGSFMLIRREALESGGLFDERFFMYSEETDLCRRIKTAGWEVRHLPQMTILHHATKDGVKPHIECLAGVTRMMYARKHFSPVHRFAYNGAVTLGQVRRALYSGRGDLGRQKRSASRQVLLTMAGRRPVPFAEITCSASLAPRDPGPRDAEVLSHNGSGSSG